MSGAVSGAVPVPAPVLQSRSLEAAVVVAVVAAGGTVVGSAAAGRFAVSARFLARSGIAGSLIV